MSTELTDAILAMDEQGALRIVKERIDGGEAPEAVLDDARVAMTTLGEKFACEEVFIPELIMGGEIMKGIAAELKPRISAPDTPQKRGTVVVGTVHGDIHDIAHVAVRFREHVLAQTKPLAVAPLLDSGDHRADLLWLPEGYPDERLT